MKTKRNKKETFEQPDPYLIKNVRVGIPRKRSLMEIVVVGLIKLLEGKK